MSSTVLPPPLGGPSSPGADGGGDGVVRAPAGIESAVPGAELAATLAELPVEQVANGDVVETMVAAHRQATHARAVFLQYVREVALRLPGPDDQVCRGSAAQIDRFAADEIAAALAWSRTRSENALGLAADLAERLPVVAAAMLAGQVDEPKAKAFSDWTIGLSDEHTTAVVGEVLPAAAELTVGQLREVIQRIAIALDPDWAQRRYEDSVGRRKVVLSQGPEGTASLAGYELPADRAVAGHTRIAALAKSCKRAGDRRPIDLIRADVYLGMIDGALHELTDEQIIAHILAHPIAGDPTTDQDTDDPNDPGDPESPSGPDDSGSPDDSGAPDDPDGPSGSDDSGDTNGPDGTGGPSGSDETDGPDHLDGPAGGDEPGNPDDGPSDGSGGSEPGAAAASDAAPSPWSPAELRVRLGTLVGLNEHPGELPGYGYLPAPAARTLAARMGAGQWRYVLCTPAGLPVGTGLLRARPTASSVGRDTRGGLVELQLTTGELDTLRAIIKDGRHAGWARVLDEIAVGATVGAADADTADDSSRAGRRFADAKLRRWVQVRDRSCLFPGCRAPANQTDQDHRRDYAAGGATDEQNLQCLCRRHHRLKHDGKWLLDRLGEMTWVWTSRLGRRYRTHPPPVMPPLPAPGTFADPGPGQASLPTITRAASSVDDDRRDTGRDGARDHQANPTNWDQPGPLGRRIQTTLTELRRARRATADLPDQPPY